MGKYCVAPKCKSGYTSDRMKKKKSGSKMPSLFKAPKDPHYFELWEKAIPHLDKELKLTDHLCELHFTEEDIECYYETDMGDGTVFRMPRGRKMLKPTAIPSIFTNVLEKVKPDLPVKRKKISHPKMQIELKKAKVPKPSNKDNKIVKKNNSPLQPGKENVLIKDAVLHPVPGNSTTTQSLFLKERQHTENTENLCHSDSQKHDASPSETSTSPCLDSGSKTSTSSCLDFVSSVNTESHSNQNMCNKISSKSPATYSKLTSSKDSYVPDVITKRDFNKSSSIKTIIEYVPNTVIERYSNNNCSIGPITESVPDAVPGKYSNKSNSVRTITKSVPDEVIEKHSIETISSGATVTDLNVPVALSNNSSNLSDYEKTMYELSSFKLTGKNSDQNMGDGDTYESEYILPELDSEEEFSFDFLKANVNMFETTNSWWRVNTFDDFVVFSRWTPYYIVERRIVITKDLAVRVFLIDKETTIGCDVKELSLHILSKLIFRVENLRICGGIDKKDSNCVGFLQSVYVCKKYNLCLNCIKWRKEEKKRSIKIIRESDNCIELLNFNLLV